MLPCSLGAANETSSRRLPHVYCACLGSCDDTVGPFTKSFKRRDSTYTCDSNGDISVIRSMASKVKLTMR